MLPVRRKLSRAWTAQEDARLARLAMENRFRHWHRVARQMPGRSHASCRDRWRDHLARDVYHRRRFTAPDDAELGSCLRDGRWSGITRAVHQRTSRVVKRRWRELRKDRSVRTVALQHPLADALAAGFSSCSLGCRPMDPVDGSLALGFACMAV
ncbi:hypothetical protein ACUV84_032395 [Puccinellia chinampoensis]